MINRFCTVNAKTGAITSGAVYQEHLLQYQLSPSGHQVIGIANKHNGPGKGTMELHLFDLNGQVGSVLATGLSLDNMLMSPSEQFIAYSDENDQIYLLDALTGKANLLVASNIMGSISWLGWVP